jgi:phosphate transport system protein
MTRPERHFAEELEQLRSRLLLMAGLVEQHLRQVLQALVDRDSGRLAHVIAEDARTDALQVEIDEVSFTLLALHQPVAVDLRTIVSAFKINADLERVGDLAVNIGEAGQRYLQHPPVKPLLDVPRMGELALKMLREAIDAFVRTDVTLAKKVLSQDEWLTALKDQILRELLTYMLGNPRMVEPCVELILISRHLERVGHHATNVAEDVIFIVEARDVRHGAPRLPATERRRTAGTAPV